MREAVDQVLTQRLHRSGRTAGTRSVLASLSLHGVLVVAILLGPIVAAKSQPPMEFVAVQIVPVQALGVRDPGPAPQQKRVDAPPREKEPAPEPAADIPVIPAPESRQPPSRQESTQPSPEPVSAGPAERSDRPTDPGQREGSPLGSSLGSSAFGAAVGGLDNPDFVYSYYIDQMLAMISSNWRRPALGGEIEAMVHFRIHRDGRITDVRVVRSSGFNSFDLAGLRAVQLAAPFPRLPQSYRHGNLGVNLILR